MSQSPSEIARVAAGLTKAQREAVLVVNGKPPHRLAISTHKLRRDGLFKSERVVTNENVADGYHYAFTLTPLGEQVRTHLLKDKA